MRCLDRNKQTIYYANYLGKRKSQSGELINYYGEPKKARANISIPISDIERGVEGTFPNYDRVLLTENDIYVNENTIFYIEKKPDLAHWNEEAVSDYDYIATRVQYSLNHLRVELTKVEE